MYHIYIYVIYPYIPMFSNLIRALFTVSEGQKIRYGIESRAD